MSVWKEDQGDASAEVRAVSRETYKESTTMAMRRNNHLYEASILYQQGWSWYTQF